MRLITSSAAAEINRMWMNPPSVYELADPTTHIMKRITKIVQSIFDLLSGSNTGLLLGDLGLADQITTTLLVRFHM
jgi:hypothetical protein